MKKETWKNILQILGTLIAAILGTLGANASVVHGLAF